MKKSLVLFFLFLLLVSTSVSVAQNVEKISREENKFIYSNSIKLFLGDTIYVKANVTNNTLSDFTLTKGITDSSNTFFIRFVYDNFGSNKATLLKVLNPFLKQLSYKAKIINKSGRYSETSIMPIIPKIYGTEMWPYKIESIILYDFKLN